MRIVTAASAAAVGALAVLLGYAALELRPVASGLGAAVRLRLDEAGVAHPVTAVLLNFRAYDTLLELVVLLLATMGVLQGDYATRYEVTRSARDPLRVWLTCTLVPVMVLAAGHLLKSGAYAPGGAFQAGALLAAAVVLLHLAERDALRAIPAIVMRTLLVLAVAVFTVAAAAGLLTQGALLQYTPPHAGRVILAIETGAMVSIAAALACVVNRQLAQSGGSAGP